MSFFNSLSIRIPLAVTVGILYDLLTYYLGILLDLLKASHPLFWNRLSFYSWRGRGISKPPIEKDSFYSTNQWVGKFYHYHAIVLFIFLTLTAIAFLISLIMDWSGSNPFGNIFQNLWNALSPMP